ncbi:MAG: LysR substrate-binding domain-containing protein [Pseudomonadota bacterium]
MPDRSINAHRIRAFAAAARTGSFSAAAKRLGISQSAVSQHVAALEREMGAPLLTRRRAGLDLTRAGASLYDLADRWTAIETALAERIGAEAALESGHLRIIANSPRPALDYIAAMRRRHPGVEIEFALLDWTSAQRMMRDRQADAAIVTEPARLDDWDRRVVARQAYHAYLRADHPLAARHDLTLRDVLTQTLLLPERGSFTRRVVAAKFKETGQSAMSVMQTTTFPLMREAILHGIGVGLFLEDAAHPDDPLVSRPVRDMADRHETCLMTPRDRGDHRALQALLDAAASPAPAL